MSAIPSLPPAPPEAGKPPLSKKQRRTARSWETVRRVATVFPLLWPDAARGRFRPMKTGIHDDVSAWIAAHPGEGLSPGEWQKAVVFLVSRSEYLRTLTAGAPRYDLCGEPAGTVTAQDALHAARKIAALKARLAKPRRPSAEGGGTS